METILTFSSLVLRLSLSPPFPSPLCPLGPVEALITGEYWGRDHLPLVHLPSRRYMNIPYDALHIGFPCFLMPKHDNWLLGDQALLPFLHLCSCFPSHFFSAVSSVESCWPSTLTLEQLRALHVEKLGPQNPCLGTLAGWLGQVSCR